MAKKLKTGTVQRKLEMELRIFFPDMFSESHLFYGYFCYMCYRLLYCIFDAIFTSSLS
jgi:hypothetical protein